MVGWVVGESESNAEQSFQLLGQKNDGQQILRLQNLGPKSFIKIRSVTAEILPTLSLRWLVVVVGGGGLKSFSCQTQL